MDDLIDALHRSDQHLVRTVDSLTPEDWSAASILPGWTKAHVVAHLALNGEALAGALAGLQDGRAVPMYASDEARDADIAELAAAAPDVIRERLFAATQRFRDAVATVADDAWSGSIDRLPGGPSWPAAAVPGARWREVEIHHADLGTTYRHLDWAADFVDHLLEQASGDHADSPDSPGFTLAPTDRERTWTAGAEAPTVRGRAADLAWWLVGRGEGEALTVDGDLPRLGPWRRSPLR